MELKVWVEGIPRVVCGVTHTTTCHDVVLALANAIGKTGRYNLIEKWRETERLLAPSDSPIKALHNWGEYANDVQFLLRYTAGGHEKNRSSSHSKHKHEKAKFRTLNNTDLLMQTPHAANIKRNLTFSGPHSYTATSPLRVPKSQGKGSPHHNSSLESLEEQSSFTSHSSTSTSPYASFDSKPAGPHMGGRPLPPDVIRHSHHRSSDNQNLIHPMQHSPSASTASSSSTTTSKEVSSPDNSIEDRLKLTDPSSTPLISNHCSQHSGTNVSLSCKTKFLDETDIGYHKRQKWTPATKSEKDLSTQNQMNHTAENHTSCLHKVSKSNARPSSPLSSSIQRHHSSHSVSNHVSSSNTFTSKPDVTDSKTSSTVISESKSVCQNTNELLQLKGKDLGEALSNADREDLMRLVNLQIERLQSQDQHMQHLQQEITTIEQHDEEEDTDLTTEISQMEAAEHELDKELQELETMSWEGKLEEEHQCKQKLGDEILIMKMQLKAAKAELQEKRDIMNKLSEDVEKESTELAKNQQDVKNQEIKLNQEISELSTQIGNKQKEFEDYEKTIDKTKAEVVELDQSFQEKEKEIVQLEHGVKEANFMVFTITPQIDIGDDGDKYHLSSASRPGSARRILYNPEALQQAISSSNETEPCWV